MSLPRKSHSPKCCSAKTKYKAKWHEKTSPKDSFPFVVNINVGCAGKFLKYYIKYPTEICMILIPTVTYGHFSFRLMLLTSPSPCFSLHHLYCSFTLHTKYDESSNFSSKEIHNTDTKNITNVPKKEKGKIGWGLRRLYTLPQCFFITLKSPEQQANCSYCEIFLDGEK